MKKSKRRSKSFQNQRLSSTTFNSSTSKGEEHTERKERKSSTEDYNEIPEVENLDADEDPISLQSEVMAIDAEPDKDLDLNPESIEESDDSSSTTSEVSFTKRPFYLKLPSTLKYTLIFDHDMITYRKALPILPAPKPVSGIINDYLSLVKLEKRRRKSLYLDDTFSFLINSFNALIGSTLLYKKEKSQVSI